MYTDIEYDVEAIVKINLGLGLRIYYQQEKASVVADTLSKREKIELMDFEVQIL